MLGVSVPPASTMYNLEYLSQTAPEDAFRKLTLLLDGKWEILVNGRNMPREITHLGQLNAAMYALAGAVKNTSPETRNAIMALARDRYQQMLVSHKVET